jgi:hypothetical protein
MTIATQLEGWLFFLVVFYASYHGSEFEPSGVTTEIDPSINLR